MHPNPAFRTVETARNLEFARDAGFGVLGLNGADGPLISHLPFVMSDEGDLLAAHIVRSNPIWRALKDGPASAVMIVSGPHGYISPDWYGVEDLVPTWNYVAVHLRGTLRLIDESHLRRHLDDLSDRFEATLTPKPKWLTDKVDEDALARMMRMIAPIELEITDVQGTWKLGQNKPDKARLAAADGAEDAGSADLAALMRTAPT